MTESVTSYKGININKEYMVSELESNSVFGIGSSHAVFKLCYTIEIEEITKYFDSLEEAKHYIDVLLFNKNVEEELS